MATPETPVVLQRLADDLTRNYLHPTLRDLGVRNYQDYKLVWEGGTLFPAPAVALTPEQQAARDEAMARVQEAMLGDDAA